MTQAFDLVATFPKGSRSPIACPIALTKASTNPSARGPLVFLRSAKARSFFEQQGFSIIDKPVSGS